jgi:Protein of unknown function (DUF3467)
MQGEEQRAAAPSVYSNHLRVGCNAFEVVLAFSQFREGDAQAVSVLSVATSPAFAKAFAETLRESLEDYERRFGPIPDVDP